MTVDELIQELIMKSDAGYGDKVVTYYVSTYGSLEVKKINVEINTEGAEIIDLEV